MQPITFKPIGVIHNTVTDLKNAPRSEHMAEGVTATVEIYPQYTQGLTDLDGFSHIILLVHFHLSEGYDLMATPFLGNTRRGVFATRSPRRPNPLGMSIVKLVKIVGNILQIENTEMVDGTPVLDIKPYVPPPYRREIVKLGWLEQHIAGRDDTSI
ncbi:MAG: tRNA (N6-threonylcarbamoyladenosine(37)-N6)-methyltransferase TrmO [candidate division Zixibacteria bacterium]|nr:tRNA (N6-threonylcarbamoyladenosine(37)-N6)-methyltransferase TrmO [candidate division Zixibacteria bacterium]